MRALAGCPQLLFCLCCAVELLQGNASTADHTQVPKVMGMFVSLLLVGMNCDQNPIDSQLCAYKICCRLLQGDLLMHDLIAGLLLVGLSGAHTPHQLPLHAHQGVQRILPWGL